MRTTRNIRPSTPERLTDEEITQHIRAAYSALNLTLFNASRVDGANYGFQSGPRYVLTLNADSANSGLGTLLDRREDRSHQIKICFGSTVSDVRLFRDYFEDIDKSNNAPVRVKHSSQAGLFRSFLEFLKSTKSSDRIAYRSHSTALETRVAAVA
jgi:hypothetical protein